MLVMGCRRKRIMKKTIYILSFFMAITVLMSCQTVVASSDDGTAGAGQVEWIAPADSVNLSGMELYWRDDNLQFVADDDAVISLYVGAQKDGDDGEFLFDTGQDWLLIMQTSLGAYPLFPRSYVQHGLVSYTAFNEYSGSAYDIFHVIVTVRQAAGYRIYDCVFDNERKEFKVVPVYNMTDVNPVGALRWLLRWRN